MDLSSPVDEDELESFRSRWREEIQQAHSPVRNKVHDSYSFPPVAAPQESLPHHSEEDILPSRADITQNNTPLEIYENAILKEGQGSISEAVIQYRRAFKMDPNVDKEYKQKYFPTRSETTSGPPPPEPHSRYSTQEFHHSKTDSDAISTITKSLTSLTLLRIEPEDPDKPCYLATIPDELLLHILLHLSLTSLSLLTRMALVCKKLFTLCQAENSLYKVLCFHYFRYFDSPSTLLLRIPDYNNDWRKMLIERPRLRFDGIYIATCHYLRPGVNDYSWNTPIHMVTYFRFIRFYPEGRCITVLTTLEPKDVVHHVTWTGSWGLKGVSHGIWRMSESGAVFVEVKGPKEYLFTKDLQIKSTSRGKHNKLVWIGFNSVNQDDGERTPLSMKNEKTFYFSKVRSYGDE